MIFPIAEAKPVLTPVLSDLTDQDLLKPTPTQHPFHAFETFPNLTPMSSFFSAEYSDLPTWQKQFVRGFVIPYLAAGRFHANRANFLAGKEREYDTQREREREKG